ncbi:MAG: phosphoribosylaminoimidazolesuccinocarboxamide synthase [Syntrophaceae bacterium]
MQTGLIKTDFAGLKLSGRGKVRDNYDLDGELLIVATDRISAFDVVMPDPIPGKGKILTGLSAFWFKKMEDIVPNHLISINVGDFPEQCRPYADVLEGRSMLVRKARTLPVECIVRGYLSGSGWKDYLAGKPVSGIRLPAGLKESAKLAEPVFTPTTKASDGAHDLPMTRAEMEDLIGKELAAKIIDISIRVYSRAADDARKKGIIIADTKMEFGMGEQGILLIDELLTPDSSRFWPADDFAEGRAQKSFDKQFLRDYLLSIKWDQKPPAPHLPEEIIEQTGKKYREALKKLTG